jgi:hypothetical protein
MCRCFKLVRTYASGGHVLVNHDIFITPVSGTSAEIQKLHLVELGEFFGFQTLEVGSFDLWMWDFVGVGCVGVLDLRVFGCV